MVVAICAQLNIIWDEADELMRLARLSHPRITVDTAGLAAEATELANLLAERIRKLAPERVSGCSSCSNPRRCIRHAIGLGRAKPAARIP